MHLRTSGLRAVGIVCAALVLLGTAASASTAGAERPQSQSSQSSPKQDTLAQRSSVKLIATPDASVKWRITDNRFVERTTDGGATWQGQELAPEAGLLAGSAPNASTCWVVGRRGVVYVTKNARTWKKVTAPVSADLVGVSAKNARTATITTADGLKFTTNDGGKKWKPARRAR